jgi:hypothetical protein
VFAAAVRYVLRLGSLPGDLFTRPLYDPETFSVSRVFTGTSIAVLTYIGFDGISTLSEEVQNPRRNILRATVLTCLVTGVLASLEVYAAQLIWPASQALPDIDTGYVHVAGRAGGMFLFHLVNTTLLVATIGSGSGSQLAAARLLYGMGRDNAIPKGFFGAIEPKRGIPRNNVLFTGAVALAGAFLMSYPWRGDAEFRSVPGVYGSERGGVRAVLPSCGHQEMVSCGSAAARVRDLPFHLVKPADAGENCGRLLAGSPRVWRTGHLRQGVSGDGRRRISALSRGRAALPRGPRSDERGPLTASRSEPFAGRRRNRRDESPAAQHRARHSRPVPQPRRACAGQAPPHRWGV